MSRRHVRALLSIAVLCLAMPPGADRAQAQAVGAIVAATSSIEGEFWPMINGEHIRQEAGFFLPFTLLVATTAEQTLECTVTTNHTGTWYPVRLRGNVLAGRGFVDAAPRVASGIGGTLVDSDPLEPDNAQLDGLPCELSIEAGGQLHRVGNVTVARVPVTLRATRAATGVEVFSQRYCLFATAEAHPVPFIPQAWITAAGAGPAGDCPTDPLPGRTADDDNEHG